MRRSLIDRERLRSPTYPRHYLDSSATDVVLPKKALHKRELVHPLRVDPSTHLRVRSVAQDDMRGVQRFPRAWRLTDYTD